MAETSETGLYDPVKALLESQGYEVKGEIGAADVVGLRGEDAPVIVEMKLRFSLALYHQALTRMTVTDDVYIAVPRPTGRQARRVLRDNTAMCRRLGLGLILVSARQQADVICDPGPYAPRKNRKRKEALLREFQRRRGDPSKGGSTRGGVVTSYRQDAIDCARCLQATGPRKGADVARETLVKEATRLMRDNHYGWFERVGLGVYGLTEAGLSAVSK